MPTSMASHTLPAVFVHAVVEKAVSLGGVRGPLIAASGLSPAQLAAPENPVPLTAVFGTWETAMRMLRDPGFPMAYARDFTVERYPILGFALMTAPSGREAFERVSRFASIVSTSGRWSLREEGENAAFIWARSGERTLGHRVANEAVLAEVVATVRQIFDIDVRATAVRLRHPAPSSTKAHDAYFGTRVTWRRDEDAVVLPASVLSASPRFANLAMASYFEKEASHRLQATCTAETLRDSVARLVAQRLMDGEPPLEAVARQLGTTERTLRRSLSEEKTSYRVIVDDVRRQRADDLLSDSTTSIAEVAFALGFSESSAFTRAYKRWTGVTPQERRRAGGGTKPG